MTARSTPQSSINNILDFLMFFNSGKTCPVTHGISEMFVSMIHTMRIIDVLSFSLHRSEFIANKIGGSSEQVTRRYNEFYLVSAFITSEADWDQSSLGDFLSAIDDLVRHCPLLHILSL